MVSTHLRRHHAASPCFECQEFGATTQAGNYKQISTRLYADVVSVPAQRSVSMRTCRTEQRRPDCSCPVSERRIQWSFATPVDLTGIHGGVSKCVIHHDLPPSLLPAYSTISEHRAKVKNPYRVFLYILSLEAPQLNIGCAIRACYNQRRRVFLLDTRKQAGNIPS